MLGYDSTWTSGGVEQALDVLSESTQGYGKMYVEYRAWRQELVGEVTTISDSSTFDTLISGADHPDNPLKYGVGKAFANSNGTPVSFTAVSDPSALADWEDVLALIEDRRDTYGLVPLTRDLSVWDAYVAHVNNQSAADQGAWRDTWFNLSGVSTKALVSAASSTNGHVVLATLTDDPNTSGTQYTLLQVPLGNGGFLDNGVRAGDIVRFLYTTDGFGNDIYTEFVVSSVVNEDSLLLVAGNGSAVNTPQKVEIWRNLTATDQATAITQQNTFSNRRVMLVWPDTVEADDLTVDGFYLCAALAGLASGVVPQQGLTNFPISGFQSVPRTTKLFSRTNLDTMAGNGVWIVTQDINSGAVFTRHALTSAPYTNINQREEMITRNLDSVSFFELDWFAPYIGISNITPELEATLRTEFEAMKNTLLSANNVQQLGPQVQDLILNELRPDALLKDHLTISQTIVLPYPLNNIDDFIVL